MNIYKQVREYRQRMEDFPEIDLFVGAMSGYLFRDSEDMNKFTNADDMFFEDNSV
jgi:hypothetical protein